MSRYRISVAIAVCLGLWAGACCQPTGALAPASKPASPSTGSGQAQPASNPSLKWEKEIQAYEAKDKISPPPQGALLFAGSSSIRLWKGIEEDFGPAPVIARGVGGCQVCDVLYYADRIVLPYKPAKIVFYAGDNDLASGKTPQRVMDDFKAFVQKVHAALPQTKIYFLSAKLSWKREKLWSEATKLNDLVREYAGKTPGVVFVDVNKPIQDADGKPRLELFKDDKLHLNRKGYELWIPVIKAALEK